MQGNNNIGYSQGVKAGYTSRSLFVYQHSNTLPPVTATLDEGAAAPPGYETNFIPRGYILSPRTDLPATDAVRYLPWDPGNANVSQDQSKLVIVAHDCDLPVDQAVGEGHQIISVYEYGNGGKVDRSALVFFNAAAEAALDLDAFMASAPPAH